MKNDTAQLFTDFAEKECFDNAPLYYQLASEIAQDEFLLLLAKQARARQPIPNLFLAAVHFLLINSPTDELANYYPSLSPQSKTNIPFALFKSFCKTHQDEILQIIKSRIVQTNVINRTAYLMPIIARFAGANPVNLVDIGSSSGLALNLDQYRYDYQMQEPFSIGNSDVRVVSTIKGEHFPIPTCLPNINRKIGIDQHPIDLHKTTEANWLKALIWPDHVLRFKRLEHAISIALKNPVQLLQAHKIEDFQRILEAIPQAEPLIVFHTHVLYQFSTKERFLFRQMIDEIGSKRDLLYIAVEASRVFDSQYLPKGVLIIQTQYKGGKKEEKLIASTKGHAQWIQFFL